MKEEQMQNMIFADACEAPLRDGNYRVTMVQDTDLWGTLQSEDMVFRVEGPRFGIGNEGVHSCFPPMDMKGGYGQILPHIVFNRRTLPWERSIEKVKKGVGAERAVPWLYLLLLREEEILPIQTGLVGTAADSDKSGDVFVPVMELEPKEKEENCQYIDIAKDLFLRIAPRPDELSWLCHAGASDKKVKSSHVRFTDGNEGEQEWFSTVMGNRFPLSSDAGSRNHVYLVSLEGYGDYEKELLETPKSVIRLFVLKDWEFYSISEKYNFLEIVKELSINTMTAATQEASKELRPILENGYLLVRHTLRNGESTVSFYRGPFVPKQCTKEVPSADTADSLYAYDPKWGVFDISYASAWQAGRLAVLNQKSIAMKIMKRRNENYREVCQRSVMTMVGENTAMPLYKGQQPGTALAAFLDEIGGRLG